MSLDQAKLDALDAKLVGVLNGSAFALMASLGHRTGLFDAMAQLPASSSRRIADAAGLSERYVREWLGTMVTFGIVEYDPGATTYWLPPEHAARLTRAAVPTNLAASMQWISMLGAVEDHVLRAFRDGQGVPYSAYHRFHDVMAEESAQTVLACLSQHILPLVPGLTERLAEGIDVLDIGCGQGRAVTRLAQLYPASRFTGVDFSAEAVAAATARARELGLTNLQFLAADVAELPAGGGYDFITAFDAIHDQAEPQQVLDRIAAALRPGGVFLMQEIGGTGRLERDAEHPMGPFLYAVSCLHCMSVSLACGGPGLGAMWGRELAERMLAAAGLAVRRVEQLPHDPINLYYVVTRADEATTGGRHGP